MAALRGWLMAAVPPLAALAMLALLLRLGMWQLERAQFKEELLQRFEINAKAAPRPLHDVISEPAREDWHFRRVHASGRFHPERQYLLDNRTNQGRAGYHVLTPLLAGDRALIVNRGWVAAGARRDELPDIAVAALPVTIRGLLVPPSEGGLLLGDSGYGSGAWPKVVQRVEMEKMAEQLRLPVVPALLLLEPSSPACFDCRWRAVQGIPPQRHRAYALQWFSLAAALVIIVVVVTVKGRRDARA